MTHPAWLPDLYQPTEPPVLNPSLVLDEQPILKRLDARFLRSNPLAADLLVRALNLDPAGGGTVAHYAQFFRQVPATDWAGQFEALLEPVVDLLADRLAETTADGRLLAWGAGLALRFHRDRLQSAPLFEGTSARDPRTLTARDYTDRGTAAWLYLSQESLERVVCDVWSRATSAEPPADPVAPTRRGRRIAAPRLIGGGQDHVNRLIDGVRASLDDDLKADIAWEEDNLHEVRNRLRAGVRAATDEPRIAHVIDMAYHVATTRRARWDEAKQMEQEDDPVTVDPMVRALNEGLFGGDARDPDAYDDEDVLLEDEDDGDEEEFDEDDRFNHEPLVNPNDAVRAQQLLALLQANPGMSAADLAQTLDQQVEQDEPAPQARPLRRRRPEVVKPRLPETMPRDWGMDTWPKDAQRFQWAFEDALHEATRRLRGVYVERFVDWIEQHDGGPTWKLGQRLWGLRLTQNEFNRLGAFRPMAERLLDESPRLALFALRVAPLLGIETIELDLLGQVKKALRERGVTDAAWKKTIPSLSASWMLDAWGDHLRMAETPVADCALNLLAWKDKGNLQTADLARMENLLADPDNPAVDSLLTVLDPSPRALQQDNPDEDDEAPEPLDVPSQERRQAVLAEAQAVEHQARLARLPSLAKAIVSRLRETSPLNFFTNEWPLVNDFLKRTELGTWQTFPEKMTWPMLWRRQQHWHDALLQAQKGQHYRYTWTSALGPFTDGTYTALPLTNGGDLWEEGKVMHHCVSDYAKDCKRGTHRIFSIRKGEQRLGTLELVHARNGAWTIGQFHAYCNQPVKDLGARAFVKLVRAAYIQAELQATLQEQAGVPPLDAPNVPTPSSPVPVRPEDEAREWLAMFKANLNANPPALDGEDDSDAPRPRP